MYGAHKADTWGAEGDRGNISRRAQELQSCISRLQAELSSVQEELAELYRNCRHDWTVVSDPEVTEAYIIPGDPKGTMGVDWQGPVPVPRKSTPRWRRTCSICKKVEYTTRFEEEKTVTKTPVF